MVWNSFDLIKGLFSYGLFKSTVPVLTTISGFLLFHAGLDKKFSLLFKKKAKTILLPLVIWNLLYALAVFFVQKNLPNGPTFAQQLYPVEWFTWLNALTGAFRMPVNYPLNFLRDLFVISLMAPFMGVFLRRAPYLGLVIALFIYYFNLDGDLVLRNSMIVNFYIGGLAATRNWNLKAFDKYAHIAAAVLIFISLGIFLFKIENRDLFIIASPFLVWPAMSLVTQSGLGKWLVKNSENSFFIFLTHGPILLPFWVAYKPFANNIPYPIFWLFTPILTIAICLSLNRALQDAFPRLTAVLLGNRGKLSSRSSPIGSGNKLKPAKIPSPQWSAPRQLGLTSYFVQKNPKPSIKDEKIKRK